MEAVTTKRRKSRKKTSVADKVFVTLNTLFMIMFVIITLYPVLNTLAISLNDGTDALRGGTVCQRDSGIYCQQKTFHV